MRRAMSLLIALVCLSAGTAQAQIPQLASTDTVAVRLKLLDSAGFKCGALDSLFVQVNGQKGDSIIAEYFAVTFVTDSAVGTNWRIRKKRGNAGRSDTSYVAYALVSNIVTAARYGLYTVAFSAHSNDAKAKERTQTDYQFQFVKYRPSEVFAAVVDSVLRGLPYNRRLSFGTSGADTMAHVSTNQILGTVVATPATAGILDVNVKNIDNDAASASGTVTFPGTIASTTNITGGTITTATSVTNAVTVTGTPAVNVTQWNAHSVSDSASGYPDVNLKYVRSGGASGTGTVTFPNGTVASTTNITAGTVTTATNVTTVNGLAANTITASAIDVTAARELADSNWEALTSNHGGAGSYGALLETNLDAAVSSRSTLTASDNIGINWADVSGPTSTVGLTNTTVGTVTTTTTATNLTNAPTNGDLTATMKSSVTAAVPTAAQNGAAAWTTTSASPATGSYGKLVQADSTQDAAIKAKTDNLPATPASTTNITGGIITTVTSVTNDVGITQAGANKVWLAPSASPTAGSFGKLVQADSILDATPASVDSVVVYRQVARGIHDSTTLDTALVRKIYEADSATYNNVVNSFGSLFANPSYMGGSGTSNWSDTQRDSLLAAITDAGKIKLRLDSLAAALADANTLLKAKLTSIKSKTDLIPASPASTTNITAASGVALAADQAVNVTKIAGQTASASGAVTFPNATVASTTNITGGTITTVTNLTNAPTAGDFTSTMKTSITTAVPTAAQNGAAAWTATSASPTAGSFGKLVQADSTQDAAIKAKTDNLPTSFPTNFSSLSIDASGRTDLGKWIGVAPLALSSQYVQVTGSLSVDSTNVYRQAGRAIHDSTTTDTALVRKMYEADSATYNGVAGSYGALFANPSYMGGTGGTCLDSVAVYESATAALLANTLTYAQAIDSLNKYQGVTRAVVGSGASTTSIPTNLTQTSTDFWKGLTAVFIKGTLAGQARSVTAYNGSTKTLTCDAFTAAASQNDTLMLIPGASAGTVTGNVTVGAYAAGQDPGTLVLDASAASHNTANSVGEKINYSGTPANWAARPDMGIYEDTVNDAAASATGFIGTAAHPANNFFKDRNLTFKTGALAGQTRRITGSTASTKTFTVDALTAAPANGTIFVTTPAGSNTTLAGSVTVGGYASGQDPATLVLVTPANKLSTDANGRVDVGRSRGITVPYFTGAGADTLPPVKVTNYATGQAPLQPITAGNKLNVTSDGSIGNVAALGTNSIPEQAFQTGALTNRVVSPYFLDSVNLTNNAADKIINRLFGADTTGHTATWFAANKMGGIMSQTAASSLDSGTVARIVWGIVCGIAKTVNNTDTSLVAQRTVSGLSVTIDSAQISRIVGRVVWGLASGSGSDSSTAAQRVISFNSQTLVNAIWNELKSAHNIPGSFAANLDVPISSVSGASGSGAYTWRIVVIDTSAAPDSVVPQAIVWVNNPAQNANPYWAFTSNTGVAQFQLNSGSWVTFTTEPGFAQYLRSFSMSATGTDTLKVYRGATGRSTFAFYNGSGAGERYAGAKITIELCSVNDSQLMVGDTVVAATGKGTITAYANFLGQASIPLYANSVFTNDSTYYRISVTESKHGRLMDKFRFRMPVSAGTVWLKDIVKWADN